MFKFYRVIVCSENFNLENAQHISGFATTRLAFASNQKKACEIALNKAIKELANAVSMSEEEQTSICRHATFDTIEPIGFFKGCYMISPIRIPVLNNIIGCFPTKGFTFVPK